MAEIENERAARKSVQHVVDFPIERSPACAQEQRIDIALHRHPALDLLAGEASVNAAFQADRIDAGLIHIAWNIFARAAGKSDHFRAGAPRA